MADAQLAELRRALVRLGFSLPAATTLLGLERRLDRSVGPAAARYAAALRAHRFDPRAPEGPAWPSVVRSGGSSARAAACRRGCAGCWRFRLAVRARFS